MPFPESDNKGAQCDTTTALQQNQKHLWVDNRRDHGVGTTQDQWRRKNPPPGSHTTNRGFCGHPKH